MAALQIPYPPSPTDVPEDLTEYPASYRTQQNLLLIGLFVFLQFYFSLIGICIILGTWCFFTLHRFPAVKIAGMVLCGTFFLYLVKGFFKRQPIDKEMHIEVTEEEQPVLFGFIHQLCEEIGAPEPNRVFLSPEVNAAVMTRSTLVNLVVQPKKDLLIGLGLVNSVNLSEFKAVLAHEFGHFSQSSYASTYTYIAQRIIIDLVEGEDWFDRIVNGCKRQQNALAIVGYAIGGVLWVPRLILWWMFKAVTVQRMTVSREAEFHADLVAVSVAGSNAMVHCLQRVVFGLVCWNQAVEDLSLASEHKLYTRDLFHHQDRSAAVVRRKKKDPRFGLPPDLDSPEAGRDVRVFDREQEELEEEEIPPWQKTHPSDADREENAKEQFVPAVVDGRSPWALFTGADELKERLTYKFYRMAFKIKKNSPLAEAVEVQKFIDDEHAETTYDPKYQGIYDGRPVEPGSLAELNQLVRESPWNDDRIDKVYEKLYEGAGGKNEEYQELRKEKATLENNTPGKPSRRVQRKIDNLQEDIDRIWEWFKSLDRRVYLVHVQMAAKVNGAWQEELVERYRFGMEVQRFYMESEYHAEKAFFFAQLLFSMDNPHPDLFAEVMQILRQAWRALKTIVQDAREINLPAMKNFEEGERLADYILEGKMVPEPPLTFVKSNWAQKLVDQLLGVRRRCGRLHWKSVGGILALQEKIAAAWNEKRAPVEAMVIEAETVEVLDAIPVVATPKTLPLRPPARGIPSHAPRATPLVAEVADAEVLDAEVVEAKVMATTSEAEVKHLVEAAVTTPVSPVRAAPSTPSVEPVRTFAPDVPARPTSVAVEAPPIAPEPPEPERLEPPKEPTIVPAVAATAHVDEPQPALPTASGEPVQVSAACFDISDEPIVTPTSAVTPIEPAWPAAPAVSFGPASVPVVEGLSVSDEVEVSPAPVSASVGPTQVSEPQLPPAEDPLVAGVARDIGDIGLPSPGLQAPVTKSDHDDFTIDLDEPSPPGTQPKSTPSGSDLFSLDADDGPLAKPVPASAALVQESSPKQVRPGMIVTVVKPPSAVSPGTRETSPAPSTTAVTLPPKNGRPAIKITFVRPGEQSPLAAGV